MELRPGYKQTEVGVIPDEWEVKQFTEVTDLITCGIAATPDYVTESRGYPFLSSTNVKEGQILWRDYKHIGESLHRQLYRNNPPQRGDVLYSRVGTIGEAAVIDVDFEFSVYVSLTLIKPRKSLDNYFLMQLLNSAPYKKRAKDQVYLGGGVGNLNVDIVRKYPIILPPLPEQRTIAAALSDVDALIGALDKLIAKKRDLKQATMQQLLTGQTRLPGFSKAWEEKRLGNVVEIRKGQLITEKDSAPGSIPVIAGGKKPAYFHNLANRTGKTVTVSASGANAGYVAFFDIPLFASDCSTISEGSDYSIEFIFFQLLLRQDIIYKRQTGEAQPHIHPVDLMPIEIGVPNLLEQIAIAAVLSDMDAEIAALEARRDKTRALKQGTMQELLTGRIRLVAHKWPEDRADIHLQKSHSISMAKHNWAFNEAVVIAALVSKFGSHDYPLGRLRYTKLAYLMHRHVEGNPEGYLKKAAGPYNPSTRYKGPEGIAQKNGYVQVVRSGKYSGFIAGENINQALVYFNKWYGSNALEWLEQFRYEKKDEIELLATIAMAIQDLQADGREIKLRNVKNVLHIDPEWQPKLGREAFSDTKIKRAIARCQGLFG
ncbi:MAG: hypothetical protein A2V87_02670 [Deltaproteobacteria bacterium RBG_16_58_17]|nr:MAG: hypothetical protein A2V87_02670 [Deltaproteobacteria bacterium RBG_16_58_17]